MFGPLDLISVIVCSPVVQGVCFKYFFEPPYPEGLALRGKVTPGKEYTGPDPAESSLGEAPPDFYCVIGEDEGPVKDPVSEVDALGDAAAGRRHTRQATRKRSASSLGQGLVLVDPAVEDNESSDGECLRSRKRLGLSKCTAAVSKPEASGGPDHGRSKPIVRVVKKQIRLPL